MRLDLRRPVAGQPAQRIRDLLRAGRGGGWTIQLVCHELKVTQAEARRVARALTRLGYIEPYRFNDLDEPHWKNTVAGNAFANASAGAPISRATAERLVKELLERVDRVNADPHYLYRVRRVVVFGSFVGTKANLGDVDLAIDLAPKEKDGERHAQLMLERAREARVSGQRFASWLDELAWGETEVQRYLRARSRYLSFHLPDEGILLKTKTRTLYEDRGSPARRPRAPKGRTTP